MKLWAYAITKKKKSGVILTGVLMTEESITEGNTEEAVAAVLQILSVKWETPIADMKRYAIREVEPEFLKIIVDRYMEDQKK